MLHLSYKYKNIIKHMKTIVKFINFLIGFRKLKVEMVAGDYAILVDQTGKFKGVANAKGIKNDEEVWGKKRSKITDVITVSHASYKHSLTVRPVAPCGKNNSWIGITENNELAVIEYYDPKHDGARVLIAANVIGNTEVPLVTVK